MQKCKLGKSTPFHPCSCGGSAFRTSTERTLRRTRRCSLVSNREHKRDMHIPTKDLCTSAHSMMLRSVSTSANHTLLFSSVC